MSMTTVVMIKRLRIWADNREKHFGGGKRDDHNGAEFLREVADRLEQQATALDTAAQALGCDPLSP